MTARDETDAILLDVVFVKCLRVASSEGRLDPGLARELGLETGSYRCGICGMLHHTLDGAAECCALAMAHIENGLGKHD